MKFDSFAAIVGFLLLQLAIAAPLAGPEPDLQAYDAEVLEKREAIEWGRQGADYDGDDD